MIARLFRAHSLPALLSVFAVVLSGCEGVGREHDKRVADLRPPPEDVEYRASGEEIPNLADHVEEMFAAREAYIERMISMERAFLLAGDTVRANWARRQRELTEKIESYPYLTKAAPGEDVIVSPEERIPEADELYAEGVKLYDSFIGIPFLGFTKLNHKDCRQALNKFKGVLAEHSRSDKVDDCAFYCGELYKEFLREDDPDNELAVRYFRWAVALDPATPHPARFNAAVVYDFRLHNREKAVELYHQVLETNEADSDSNQRFAATRIEQLTDDAGSHIRPKDRKVTARPRDE